MPRFFSAAECEKIEGIFEKEDLEVDKRQHEGISRRNYWLKDHAAVEWVLEKIRAEGIDGELEFALMHEFLEGDFFDWHVDTKPGDGTSRTTNVNVILSTDFQGGALQLGSTNASLGLGDTHAYPAALPHKVHDISKGKRRTLVLALKGDRSDYWSEAKQRYENLCQLGLAPKLHWIFGDFYTALGHEDQARSKYADAYRVTPERQAYVDAFAKSASEHHAAGRLTNARDDLQMCLAIEPSQIDVAVDLAVVLCTLRSPADAVAVLETALPAPSASSEAAVRVVLSFALRDLGRHTDSDQERQRALALDPDVATDAITSLHDLLPGGDP